MLVYLRTDEILDSFYLRIDEILGFSRLLWTSVAPSAQQAEVAYGSSCSCSVPFFVSGHRVLPVSDAQAVLRPMAPAGQHRGAPGLLARPHSRIKQDVARFSPARAVLWIR